MFLKLGLGALAALALTNPAMANETATSTQITGAIDTAGDRVTDAAHKMREWLRGQRSDG